MQVKDLIVTGDARILGNIYTLNGPISGGLVNSSGGSGSSGYTISKDSSGTVTLKDGSGNSCGSFKDDDTKYSLPAASTNLGGVKSGGDVSINNGEITINDDSHNHIIANIDGLQDALDGKSASDHTHNYASFDHDHDGRYNNYVLPIATTATLGGVKAGTGVVIESSTGKISVNTASTTTKGLVAVGKNITCSSQGYISLTSSNVTGALGYTPLKSTDVVGRKEPQGSTFTLDGSTYTIGSYAESFNNPNSRASGNNAHAEGWQTYATGNESHSEGCGEGSGYVLAAGQASHAEGVCTEAAGKASHAEGVCTEAAGKASHAAGYYTQALLDYQYVVGTYNKTAQSGGLTNTLRRFIVGNGSSTSAVSNAFTVLDNGTCYCPGGFKTAAADYAEYFEWFDGNLNNEDRRGLFVTLKNEKIMLATAEDDYILGIISATPSVVGDSADEDWHAKYKTDIFNEILYEKELNESGLRVPQFNPQYDSNREYIPRQSRKEWSPVGLLGKLIVVDDGTCVPNGYCYPGQNGIATASTEKTSFRVMERLDETHIRVFVK